MTVRHDDGGVRFRPDARVLERIGALGGSIGATALLVVLVAGDHDAPRHSLWRDPISWFAAAEAPRPDATRTALVVTGVSCVVLAIGGLWAGRSQLAVGATAVFGSMVVALALVPVECSLRIDYCEGLVRAGLVGGAQLAHAVIAGIMFVGLAALSGWIAFRTRTAIHAAVALMTVAATAVMVLAPANDRVGPLQWIALAGGISALVTLWRQPTLLKES